MLTKLKTVLEILEKLFSWLKALWAPKRPSPRLADLVGHLAGDCETVYRSGRMFPLPTSRFRLRDDEKRYLRKVVRKLTLHVMQRCYNEHILEKIRAPESDFELEQALRSARAIDPVRSSANPGDLVADLDELCKILQRLSTDPDRDSDIRSLALEALDHLTGQEPKSERIKIDRAAPRSIV